MTFSIRRFQAIVSKEWKDALKNPQILLMAGLPVMFAFIFSKMGENAAQTISYPILMALAMTGAFVQAMMVAEEKEKHTLRVLMLSPAKTSEILLGKSFLTAVVTLIAIVLSVVVMDATLTNVPLVSVMILLLLIMFIALGTIIGLLSRTVSESSIVGLPVLLIFIMGPTFGPMLDSELLTKVVRYLPTDQFIVALTALMDGAGLTDISSNLLHIVIWMAGSIILSVIVYAKKRFD